MVVHAEQHIHLETLIFLFIFRENFLTEWRISVYDKIKASRFKIHWIFILTPILRKYLDSFHKCLTLALNKEKAISLFFGVF